MTDSFVVAVGGSPSSLRAAGEWLRHKVECVGDAIDYSSGLNVSGPRSWSGSAAEAFSAASRTMVEASRQITDIAGPFAEVLHTYAGRLERMQNHFEGVLRSASVSGLKVEGTRVWMPAWNGPAPQSRDADNYDQWERFTKLRRDYQRAQIDVVEWHADNEAWIYENIVLFAASLPNASLADDLLGLLQTGVDVGMDIGEPLVDRGWEARIETLRDKAANWREAAEELRRKAKVSGDPALRALLQEKIDAKLPDSMKAAAGAADSVADILRTSRKVVPVVGAAVEIAVGVWDIANGEEPVDVVVGWGGGFAGGAAGSAVATGAGVGFLGVAGAATGGALLGGALIPMAWEKTPPSWREGIYSWAADGFIVAGDVGEKVGDWFVDRWMDLSGSIPQ